jgi:hypothetical protein
MFRRLSATPTARTARPGSVETTATRVTVPRSK